MPRACSRESISLVISPHPSICGDVHVIEKAVLPQGPAAAGWTPRFCHVSKAGLRMFVGGIGMVRWTLTAAAFLSFGWSIAPAGAGPLSLAPHRAVYDLSLAESGGTGSVASVSGRMVMEFTGSRCSGYTTKLRFVTQTEDSDGQHQVTDSRASTFEAGDGRRLDFTNETYTDDALAEPRLSRPATAGGSTSPTRPTPTMLSPRNRTVRRAARTKTSRLR
jgi:hypothetical protein